MNATILPNSKKHYPVLLKEILSIISPQNGGTFIDCTFGQGGYSKEILKFNLSKNLRIAYGDAIGEDGKRIKNRNAIHKSIYRII